MMRAVNVSHIIVAVELLCLSWIIPGSTVLAEDKDILDQVSQSVALQNEQLGLVFDRNTCTLRAIENRLTGETYRVHGDEFDVEAVQFHTGFADAKLVGMAVEEKTLTANYQSNDLTIQARYTLRGHFAEKELTLQGGRNYGLKKLIVSRPTFSGPQLQIVAYRYPKFGRQPGEEPDCTFFGRTVKGGFFTGLELPFSASTVNGNEVALGFAPSLKMAAGEKLVCEPAYFGVYRRGQHDKETAGYALASESAAMVAMTSAILGTPRFGLVPMACGWHSEMEHGPYTDPSVAGDMKSLDFLASCGIDWVSDSHPWGGEIAKMNALGPHDKYKLGPHVRTFVEHATKVGVKVVMWLTMTNTHPWGGGKPFRADKPEWQIDVAVADQPADLKNIKYNINGNCMGNRAFVDWLDQINLEGMASGHYPAWVVDGDFFGSGAWCSTVVPIKCRSDKHDHLPGDSNYACQRALCQLIASLRKHYPDTYIFTCRPAMDLGVWSLRNLDVCFTLVEFGKAEGNLVDGNEIRTCSRERVQRDFFPHYIDQPLLFAAKEGGPCKWQSEKLDYELLSALSSSPNQLFYMPTKSGIPDKDKAIIRNWLAWGRKNIEYLKVRKDLPDGPAVGKVDGSAHIVSDRGLVFLFNSGKIKLSGQFALTEDSIGLKGKGNFQVSQEYPASDRKIVSASGQTVRWEVPAESVIVLRIQPAQ
jgi:hypothetical protein